MKYTLLINKLNTLESKFITSDEIKKYCTIIDLTYSDAIRYLTRYKHLHVIFKGIFYKPTLKERKLNSLTINHFEAITEALKIKGIKHWYFALETALKFNKITHEFFTTDFIISDTIFRAKPLTILGNKVKFIKLKLKLATFGIKEADEFRYSDIEKTALDMIYLKKYAGMDTETIKTLISPLLKHCSKRKLETYAKKYNKTIEEFITTL